VKPAPLDPFRGLLALAAIMLLAWLVPLALVWVLLVATS
jgi:hypothetical protein